MHDCIIIGAGAAGLTAGIYASRRAVSTLIISSDIGGQAALTNEVENYPGVGFVSGFDLMQKFKEAFEQFGGTIVMDEVNRVEVCHPEPVEGGTLPTVMLRQAQHDIEVTTEQFFTVHTMTGVAHESRAVIFAFGLTPMQIGASGESELRGKGVSYCATCDGPFFKGKAVAVVGGGNSALDAALYLSKICTKVYMVHRRDAFRGEAVLAERVKQQPNIEILYNSVVAEIMGTDKVSGVVVADVNDAEKKTQKEVNGVFVEVGYHAKTKWLEGVVALDERRQIVVDSSNRTNVPGIFAAGDVTNINYKQIVISSGEGAKAALEMYKYLQTLKGKAAVAVPDWGLKK